MYEIRILSKRSSGIKDNPPNQGDSLLVPTDLCTVYQHLCPPDRPSSAVAAPYVGVQQSGWACYPVARPAAMMMWPGEWEQDVLQTRPTTTTTTRAPALAPGGEQIRHQHLSEQRPHTRLGLHAENVSGPVSVSHPSFREKLVVTFFAIAIYTPHCVFCPRRRAHPKWKLSVVRSEALF
ncbi:hypothetical protein ElyMa_004728100 [Elysia marginata]|uniref:Uncharacterized protein n=1 Tax=Elysia marginata TaxID=1093978 RepID=A0AAV4IA78_9GAST|nr:hypothetical protein ElyMa_004728100 [Elysia marginata]